ncbi:MAG: metallophosphoesterase family protein [Planctomycetota bacterium]
MRYGLMGDIHANVRAFQTALENLQAAGVDKIIFLGDLVGYGPDPGTCIDMFAVQPNVLPISGNHDRQVLGEKDPNMRRTAARALEWTRKQLAPNQIQILQSFPQGRTVEDAFIIVHGSLVSRDAYILNMKEVELNRKCMVEEFAGFRVCFFAHTHVPLLIGSKTVVTDLKETKAFKLDPNDVYLINPGSVGQPRDKCPLSAFGVFDTDNWTMTFHRVPYDIAGTREAIQVAGLPEKFARRLELGA